MHSHDDHTVRRRSLAVDRAGLDATLAAVPVPEGCDLRQASSVSIGAIALQGVRRANLALGESVVVIGLGLLGQLTAQLTLAAGCRVVGVDNNPRFLEVAMGHPEPVKYVQADMREFSANAEFDAVVNWFTSFGYFDDATDRAILAGWRRALKAGGKLIIDHQNPQRLLAVLAAAGGEATILTERGDDLMIDRTTFDVATARSNTERITVRERTGEAVPVQCADICPHRAS